MGSYAGIYRDIIEPFLTIDAKQACSQKTLSKPIKIEFRELAVNKYVPEEEIDFSIKFHIKNYSDCTYEGFKMTYYGISIGNGKSNPIIIKRRTVEHSEFKILPQQQFKLSSGSINWNAPKKDLNFKDFIGLVKHEYSIANEKAKIIDYEYFWLILDKQRNELGTGVPPDYILLEFQPTLDSLKLLDE